MCLGEGLCRILATPNPFCTICKQNMFKPKGLLNELDGLALHVFRADYQKDAYDEAVDSLCSSDRLISVQDFSENYRTLFQDEIQSAHFCYEQASLFTQESV